MQTPAAGSGTPSSRSATSVATVRPPPAESPATTRLAGGRPRGGGPRDAAAAASSAAGDRGPGGARGAGGGGGRGRRGVGGDERPRGGRARDRRGKRRGRAGGADDVAAPVEVEDDDVRARRRWREPLGGGDRRRHALDGDVGGDGERALGALVLGALRRERQRLPRREARGGSEGRGDAARCYCRPPPPLARPLPH